MARIPTLMTPGDVQTGQVAPRISFAGPESMAAGGRAVAGGLMDIAQGAERAAQYNKVAAEKLKQRQEYDDHLWSEGAYTKAQRDWIQWTQDVQKNGSENVVDQFNTQYTDYQKKLLDSAPTPGARDRLKLKLDDLGTQVFDSSLKIEAANKSKNTIGAFTQMLQDSSDSIAQVPELYKTQQERLSQTLQMSIAQTRVSPEVAQKMQEQIDSLAADAAEAMIPTNPERAKEIIDSAKGIDWSRRHSILNEIGRAQESNTTLFHYQQQELMKSNLDSLSQTGKPVDSFNVEQYVTSFPVKQREAARLEAMSQIKIANTVFAGSSELKGANSGKINEVLSKYEPKPGSATYDDESTAFKHLTQVAQQQIKLQKEDPFSYSRQDPIVDGAWKLVENLPKDATPELRAQLTSQAMDSSVNFQKSLGIPDGKLSVMSNQQSVNLAAKINQGSVQDVQQTFSGMQQSFGKYYANAFRDLARLPDGQRIDGAMQIVGLHLGQPFIADFIQAIRTPSSDYKLDPADKKVLGERLNINSDFSAFSSALTSANPGAVSYVDDFRTAILKYATSLVARGKVNDPKDAVQQATDLIIKSAYAFTEIDGASIAIKRQQDRGTIGDEHVPLIAGALTRIKEQITPDNIDQSKFQFPPNLSPETRTQSIKDTIAHDTFWVTNPQNDGVQLFMNGLEGTSAPIRGKDGKPITYKFMDLISQGQMATKGQPWKINWPKRNEIF